MVSHLKRQKADDIKQKLWWMQTTQMILCFKQIPPTKPNPFCLAWNEQQETFDSTLMQINKVLCFKQEGNHILFMFR